MRLPPQGQGSSTGDSANLQPKTYRAWGRTEGWVYSNQAPDGTSLKQTAKLNAILLHLCMVINTSSFVTPACQIMV